VDQEYLRRCIVSLGLGRRKDSGSGISEILDLGISVAGRKATRMDSDPAFYRQCPTSTPN